jgi:Tol biopolymer transport system component
LPRTGDPGGAAEPTFSHDGTQIVYVSGNSFADGRFSFGPGDLYAVPFANRAGGTAQKLNGASDLNYTEYYPAFSPDDAYIAFTRVAVGVSRPLDAVTGSSSRRSETGMLSSTSRR